MNSELAVELVDEAQLKTAIRELCKLRKECEPSVVVLQGICCLGEQRSARANEPS